jgi:two-component system heavy metal sensor histidine kinase CusS
MLSPPLLKTAFSDVEGDVTAHIDRRLFHRSLANLLENSARHSPSHSTVTVRLSEKDNQACVEVSKRSDSTGALTSAF